MTLHWIRVDGTRLAGEDDRTVELHGVGLGGWMNMENFITGYPGNEERIRRLLLDAMGRESYDAVFDEFLEGCIDDADAARLPESGIASVPIPGHYRHFHDDSRPLKLKAPGLP